jgi:archaellum biogenesis ATPase FlaH
MTDIRINTTLMSDVEPKEVEWLWKPYIPIGYLTFLEGDPGLGKSMITMAITGALTTGNTFLPVDGPLSKPSNILMLAAEDIPETDIRPRLDAAKADASRVRTLDSYEQKNTEGRWVEHSITLADPYILDMYLEEWKPILVIIDPLHAYFGSKIDMNRANEVRPILKQLTDLAHRHRCAIVCVRHVTKAATDKAIYRGQGSIDFTAAARSVLVVGYEPNTDYMGFAHIKSNHCKLGPTIRYKVDEDMSIHWAGLSSVLGKDLLGAPKKDSPSRRSIEELAQEAKNQLIENAYTFDDLKIAWNFSAGRTKQVLKQLEEEKVLKPNSTKTLWLVERKNGVL